ncbi:hypothetical protein K438DRAFT_262485 [Mycena galopus ATCC 62051]|nr:hypothetical protein K438DRAFT_262485 [Mycena galopus ATCC 62051]
MAITCKTSARTSSPSPSENSDMYYDDFSDGRTSPSPAPSQTADILGGWESDSTPAPMDSQDITPTPQHARTSPAALVVELSRDEFPPLASTAPATATKARAAKATKASKGKARATRAGTPPPTHLAYRNLTTPP